MTLEVTAATTTGSRHRANGRGVLMNNQDAFLIGTEGDLTLAAISDGCGSGRFSEFGSRLTVNLLVKLFRKAHRLGLDIHDPKVHTVIYQQLIFGLLGQAIILMDTGDADTGDLLDLFNTDRNELARRIAGTDAVRYVFDNYLMATAGIALMGPQTTTLLGAGDFVFDINGEVHIWEPGKGNAPLYPAYAMVYPDDDRFGFQSYQISTSNLMRLMFATDGGSELLKVCNDPFYCIPGTETPVGQISQIWANDRFYYGNGAETNATTGSDELGLWLNSLSQNWRNPGPPHHGGLLDDDTTLFAVRRKENVEA